jgi:hypothetical protein
LHARKSESVDDDLPPLNAPAGAELPDQPEIRCQVLGLARDDVARRPVSQCRKQDELICDVPINRRPTPHILKEGFGDKGPDRF